MTALGFRPTPWTEARRLAYGCADALPAREAPLAEAIGRVLARDVTALVDVPHYASSAMDGWAVAGDPPWQLVAGSTLSDGQAVPVVTGGTIPRNTRGILRSEHGAARDDRLFPGCGARPGDPVRGAHIRSRGEEAGVGDILISAGEVLNPAHIALAAVCGNDTLRVVPRPDVALVFTGSEVVVNGLPAPGQVRDTFGPQFPAFIALLGAQVCSADRIGDDLRSTVATLDGANADVLVSTGGTGGSGVDQLRPALAELGARILADRVAMRPGGPTVLAQLPDGRWVVCLPGNPLAAMMGMLTVVQPLLAALAGRRAPETIAVRTATARAGRDGTTLLQPYRLASGLAVPSSRNGSGMLRGLAEADGVLVVPAAGIRAGEPAEAIPLPWLG